jgi:hypothetical protein
MSYGLLRGQAGAYKRRYVEERDLIDPVLASHPAFARVEICVYSVGGIYRSGPVGSDEDLERLRVAVAREVGEPRAKVMLAGVYAEGERGDVRR